MGSHCTTEKQPPYLDYYPSDVVIGFIRDISSTLLPKSTIIPLEVIILCQRFAVLELIVSANETRTLASDISHKYDRIIIHRNATLTTTNWNGIHGGKLFIECRFLKIESNGKIDGNGKGYRGGQHGGYQGESYNGKGDVESRPNTGGGGGGYLYGGGAGYGTKGSGGDRGGCVYGDIALNTMYLGSGGGGGYGGRGGRGGNGGGIIKIISERMVIEENGSIEANGDNGHYLGYGGGGSGGSIYIECEQIVNDGQILAKGGKGGGIGGGDGGFGRIRVDSSNLNNAESIIPAPFSSKKKRFYFF